MRRRLAWRQAAAALLVLAALAPQVRDAKAQSGTEHAFFSVRGLWVQFERRGWPNGYWPGEVIQTFNQFDAVVGTMVSAEVALQLGEIRKLGVNTITIELRAADLSGNFAFPACNIDPVLGFRWPQPTATELANLTPFLNLVQSQGMKVILVLTSTHMEEGGSAAAQTWLGSILNIVKNHPALDFVVFNGAPRTIDSNGDGVADACGVPAEAPLYLGPLSVPANYIRWAIGFAMSLGMPPTKLAAGTIVGDFFTDSEPPAGPEATDGHLWAPVRTMKAIFDSLGIPDSQRNYALSFYEHRKCLTAQHLPCSDTDPGTWADQTLQGVYNVIGRGNGARVVAYEMGNLTPVDPSWPTEAALVDLANVMTRHGMDGGSFWRWTNILSSEDSDPTLAVPIKRRGTAFNYTTVKPVLARLYGACLGDCSTPPVCTVTAKIVDTNGDRHGDFFLRRSDGTVALYMTDGFNIAAGQVVGKIGTDWSLVGVADFNGDGSADMLFRRNDGTLSLYLMSGFGIAGAQVIGKVGPEWTTFGIGDFNGDGRADILLRRADGMMAIFLMNGFNIVAAQVIGQTGPQWTLIGIGDFNGDGRADLLTRRNDGTLALYLMNGFNIVAAQVIGQNGTDWSLKALADLNGDGRVDMLFRRSNGTLAAYLMNGFNIAAAQVIGQVGTEWTLVGLGDVNGDGRADLQLRRGDGMVSAYLMNGFDIKGVQLLGQVGFEWSSCFSFGVQ